MQRLDLVLVRDGAVDHDHLGERHARLRRRLRELGLAAGRCL
jgi:hypothetical protein